MTSIDQLIGTTYGNDGNGSEKEQSVNESPSALDINDVKNKKKKRKYNQKSEFQQEEKNKRQCIAYKYSSKGKGDLHEAVIIGGLPVFLKYENGDFKTVEQIEEASRIIKPPYQEEYPYESYDFSSIEEVKEYGKQAKLISIDSLYTQVKKFVADYNDQDLYKLNLLSLDIIYSYFQDKFATTHYESIVGDNDSGKSSLGFTFGALGYRPVYMTDPSAANIFRSLGTIEAGQCTIVLDESDKIDRSPEMMAILKTGYQLSGKVPKINSNTTTFRQEFFWTYGIKIIISEKSMSITEAKGVHDRTFSYTAYPGDPAFDIKETLNVQGDIECQKRLKELMSFRKLLLIHRLLHFKDPVTDIHTGLKRRNRELAKPVLQLFCNAEWYVQKEIASTLEGFLRAKQTRKENTIEAALYPIIVNLVSQDGGKVRAKDIWEEITVRNLIAGHYNEKKPNQYETEDYGTIYRNSITNIICDKLGAHKEHKQIGSVLIFDTEKLTKIGKSYGFDIRIQLKFWEGNNDDSDDSDGFSKSSTASKDDGIIKFIKSYDNNANIFQINPYNSIYNPSDKNETASVTSIKPSELSELSANDTAEQLIPNSIYRIGSSDVFGCKNCKVKGDKPFMMKHPGNHNIGGNGEIV